MASLGSYIRSAARATFSAYRSAADPLAPGRRLGGADVRDPGRLRGHRRRAHRPARSAASSTTRSALGGQPALQRAQPQAELATDRSGRDRLGATRVVAERLRQRRARADPVFDTRTASCCAPRARSRSTAPRRRPTRLCSARRASRDPTASSRSRATAWRCASSTPSRIGRSSSSTPARCPTSTTRSRRVRFFLSSACSAAPMLALLAGLVAPPAGDAPDRRADRCRPRDRAHARPSAGSSRSPRPTTRSPSWRAPWRACSRALDAARGDTESMLDRQREFVADASHELRTPLTSVLANLELLAEELEGEQAETAQAALRSTRRMRRLVGDLLLLARADAERMQPRPPDRPGRGAHRGRRRARADGRAPRAVDRVPSRRSSTACGRAAPAGAQPDRERRSATRRPARTCTRHRRRHATATPW